MKIVGNKRVWRTRAGGAERSRAGLMRGGKGKALAKAGGSGRVRRRAERAMLVLERRLGDR